MSINTTEKHWPARLAVRLERRDRFELRDEAHELTKPTWLNFVADLAVRFDYETKVDDPMTIYFYPRDINHPASGN